VLRTLPRKFSEIGTGSGVVAASVKVTSGFEARSSVGAGKTPLQLCPGRLAAIPNRPGLTDFAVAGCSRATRSL
jgi:hypothetical protein